MAALTIFYLAAPAGVLWLCRKILFLNKIGPILLLYGVGIVVGNLPVMPAGAHGLQEALCTALVPLAIPMMLFNSDFRRFPLRSSLLTLLCGTTAVVLTVVAGYLLFRNDLGPERAQIGGMLTGVYTGGTPNLAALKLMLGVRDETYILLNSYDMIISFFYLLLLMSFGIGALRRLLPGSAAADRHTTGPQIAADPYAGFFRRKNISGTLKAAALSAAILGLSAGVATLVPQRYFMAVAILTLTTAGIAASLFKPVRSLAGSYDAGMYLVYIFSIVVASMADPGNLDLRGGIHIFAYMAFVIFVSLAIQTVLSRLLRIDADTMIISSVALINSPPMVPMMAAAMKNRSVIVTGLGVGIVGYAAGNYLGFLICELLKTL